MRTLGMEACNTAKYLQQNETAINAKKQVPFTKIDKFSDETLRFGLRVIPLCLTQVRSRGHAAAIGRCFGGYVTKAHVGALVIVLPHPFRDELVRRSKVHSWCEVKFDLGWKWPEISRFSEIFFGNQQFGKNAMTSSLSLVCAKTIYRNAIDPRASGTESTAWWDEVVDEMRDVVAARTIADAARRAATSLDHRSHCAMSKCRRTSKRGISRSSGPLAPARAR